MTKRDELVACADAAMAKYADENWNLALGTAADRRELATAALDAILAGLSASSPEMIADGDEAGDMPTHGGSARVLQAMLSTLEEPKT